MRENAPSLLMIYVKLSGGLSSMSSLEVPSPKTLRPLVELRGMSVPGVENSSSFSVLSLVSSPWCGFQYQ